MVPLLTERELIEVPVEWCAWVCGGGSSDGVPVARNLK